MKALRWRLMVWFGFSLLVVVTILIWAADWHLEYELRKEKWERTVPNHPDWILHGSFTDREVHDILKELLQFWFMIGTPVVGGALVAAYFLARQSVKPVHQVNEQLVSLGAQTLNYRIKAPDADPEIAELVRHLNELLDRLESSFHQLTEYTSQVAHELRTPLQLMRLQVDSHAAGMDPALAEDLQRELARLSNYVAGALTIARAEHGRLELAPEVIALKAFLNDTIEPFSRLAAEEKRRLFWSCSEEAKVWIDKSAFRQILFNLLNNAFKHGSGDIFVRARERGLFVTLLIGNRRGSAKSNPSDGLGIGLRLVRALVSQSQGAGMAFRRGGHFWVQLRLNCAPRVEVPETTPASS